MSYDPIDEVLRHEGGFSLHPEDKGNWYKGKLVGTNFGITGKVYAMWLKRDVTQEDMRSLTVATAREIYEKLYLTDPRIHTLPNPPMTLILDMSINHGPGRAIKIMQSVINMAGFGPVTVDGVLGPKSRAAALAAQSRMGPYFQNAIVEERIKFYRQIVRNDPSQQLFLKGWLRRAESFKLPLETARAA